ncbi:MAG: hypothetical protein WBA93_22420 [Microcoleaceae cyanobacterium]
MNHQNERDFKNIPKIDEEYLSSSFEPVSNIFKSLLKSLQGSYNKLLEWFQEIPQWGKIITLIIVPLFIIKILEAIISLVSLSISIFVFGGVIYIGYKFLILPNSSGKGEDKKQ